MENKKVRISLTSHNINGFSGSEHYLKTRCNDNANSIICVQEHWLRPVYKRIKSINQLRTVHSAFDGYGVSAMKNTHYAAVSRGRPYGGTGFVFSKHFTSFLQPVLQYEGERVSVMKILDSDCTILIINVYFPFKQSGDEYRVQYLEILGYLENIITSNPNAKFVITGDWNCNIFDDSQPMTASILEFLRNYDLISSHDLDTSFSTTRSYTRCCLKSGTYSIIDYIFFSRSLQDRVKGCTIEYDGRNPSDHFPVSLQLDVEPQISGDGDGFGNVVNVGNVAWNSLHHDVLSKYETSMEALLDTIVIPTGIVHGDKYCSCDDHIFQIEQYFQSIITVLEIADSLLPRKSSHGKKGKDFWTSTLTQLKSESVEAYNAWSSNGHPTSGPFFERKKSSHYIYKAELRKQRRALAAEKSEALGKNLMDTNFVGFWRDWKRVSQPHCPPVNRIDDAINEPDIASVFHSYFQQIYGENGTNAHNALQREFNTRFPEFFSSKQDESISPFLLTWEDMTTIAGKLKEGKSTNSFITAEHILHGSPKLIIHLHLLFNSFLIHGFVPTTFLRGTISPTIKNNSGNLNSVDNYRGITLCSVFSHMFENALRLKFGRFLASDDLQFGFKPRHSTNHAVFTLKSCVDYFTRRDSNVFVAFLDFSKAFDTISHCGLFLKLIERKVPLCFLLIIMFWYLNMEYDIKWASARSDSFRVLCGTKQGGILSPDFFSIYINDLIIILKQMGIGCHIIRKFIACIVFADDVSLIAPTRKSLQQLLNACAEYCLKFCLKFNISKTKIIVFGKLNNSLSSLAKISFQGETVEFAKSCRYLGFHIIAHTHFKFSIDEDLRGFFGSVNSILSCLKKPKENVLIQLLYSNCVSKLTYGAAIKDLSALEKNRYNVAVNNAVRRIFGFRYFQSIRQIREFYGYDSIEVLFAKAKKCFLDPLYRHDNSVLRLLSTLEI